MENTLLRKHQSKSSTNMNSFEDDGEDNFGDFQTCHPPQSQLATNISNSDNVHLSRSVEVNPATQNIFQTDWFQFKTFRTNFEEQLTSYFQNKQKIACDPIFPVDYTIRSQEDVINDCPLWYNLSGSFNTEESLSFIKSLTFKRFYQSLKLEREKSCSLENDSEKHDLPANTKKLNMAGDEEDIANDLDMHSLIFGSFEPQQQKPSDQNRTQSIDADQVIKEIESLYSNQPSPIKAQNKICDSNKTNRVSVDPLLSLNAATLLDAALKTWKANEWCMNNRSMFLENSHNKETIEMYDSIHEQEDENESESQFHSLPANLNDELNHGEEMDNNNIHNNLDNSVLELKASNVMLQAKLGQTANNNRDKNAKSRIEKFENYTMEPNKNDSENAQKEFVKKLSQLTIVQLNELYMELEQIIQIRSEVLIQELALRDELEFEKEQRNTFISLLLSVQNKRRHYMSTIDRRSAKNKLNNKQIIRRNSNTNIKPNCTNNSKRNTNSIDTCSSSNNNNRSSFISLGIDLTSIGSSIKETILPSQQKSSPVYLTTVIPYTDDMIPIDLPTLQILIKLLKALNEDSSTVPALLTDYILKVICP